MTFGAGDTVPCDRVTGLANKDIATALDVGRDTVHGHIQNILRKIGLLNRTQAVVWALEKGLV